MAAKILATALLILCGLGTFYYLFLFSVNDFLRPLEKKCFFGTPKSDAQVTFYETGFAVVDKLACFGSAFFHPVCQSAAGLLISREFFALAFPMFVLMAFESQRPRAGGVMTWYPLVSFLCTTVAFGIIFPMVWVPGYFWKPKKAGTELGSAKVTAITLSILVVAFAYTSMLIPPLAVAQTVWITPIMLLSTLVSVLFYYAPQGEVFRLGKKLSGKDLNNPRLNCFAVFSGISVVLHYWAILDFLSTPGASLIPAIMNAGPEWRPQHFLIVDLGMCIVSCVLFILLEDVPNGGVKGVVEFLVLSVVVGPGSSLCHVLQFREMFLIEQEAQAAKEE